MKSNGTLKAAINTGLISPKVLKHQEIYEYYLSIKGKYGKMTAVTIVSEDKKVCERTVHNIVKNFNC